MAEVMFSVARIDLPELGRYGWQVMRHDGKQAIPVGMFLTSAEASAEADRLTSEHDAEHA